MKQFCTRLKIIAAVLAAVAVVLIVVSFFVPPRGVIDGSVLAAVGELFAFASLFIIWESIDSGMDAKITHGDTKIELSNDDKN